MEEHDTEHVVRFLRALYEHGGITKREFSEKSGVSTRTITAVLDGQTVHPRANTLDNLAGVFGLSAEDLLRLARRYDDQLDDLAIIFTAAPGDLEQFVKAAEYLKAHPGVTAEEVAERFPVYMEA